ncbi:hypothetical protein [Cohnella fermenti]|uniref:Uncharacterized protein n=1 Tax=Cohnella fermenti TaxID=2565925 RepID=A0A4S4BI91_9BACL|nr:hypothetical protein [Cohnella fermenti]THF73684.1 hypothetical protein E6C55_28280 [Cohnella fermenti]
MSLVEHSPPGLFQYHIDFDESGRATVTLESESPDHQRIYRWLSRRVAPKERQDITRILESSGIGTEYDMWSLNKYTHSMRLEDYYWISNDMSEKYEEIHIKHLIDTGQFEKIKEFQDKGILPR